MSNEEIIEGNQLIAEFVKLKIDGDWYLIPYLEITTKTGWYQVNRMQFHSSWDWLMPVCKKIDNIYKELRIQNGNMNEYVKMMDAIDLEVTQYNIESVHATVIEFIKWYNQTPTP